MIYGSLQGEFIDTKYNDDMHRFRALVFGKIVVYICKPINNIS